MISMRRLVPFLLLAVALSFGDDAWSAATHLEQDVIAERIANALKSGKADSPDAPKILGDIRPGQQVQGAIQRARRFIGWTFGATADLTSLNITAHQARLNSSTYLFLFHRPADGGGSGCNAPWRMVTRRTGTTLRLQIKSEGDYLIVVGPGSPRSSGKVFTTLLADRLDHILPGGFCPLPPGFQPPPPPLADTPTAAVGAIDGAFTVTESGTASYMIPIHVPPGRAGMAPQLFLTIGSGGGNGPLGLGGALRGLSAITRCQRDIAHDGEAAQFAFNDSDLVGTESRRFAALCLDGQRLIRLDDGTYRTEREVFSHIAISAASALNGPVAFEVRTKDGRILTYGKTSDAISWGPLSQPADPSSRLARSWLLSRIEDRSGNFMTIEYQNDRDTDGSETREVLPSRIAYTGHKSGLQPSRFVLFHYRMREDVLNGYSVGLEIKRTQLLDNIEVTGPEVVSGSDHTVRRYELSYALHAATGHSRLVSITERAADGVAKPPTTFAWLAGQAGSPEQFANPGLPSPDVNNWPGGNPPTQWIPGAAPRRLLGPDAPENALMPWVNGPPHLLQRIDMNGDGLGDLLFPSSQGGDRLLADSA